jgi:endonuclease-3
MLDQLKQLQYTPFQLLIATVLSSRTKDSTTISTVKKLFLKYPLPKDFVQAEITELEQALYGIGFYHVKAKNIQKLSKIILEQYFGLIPHTLEELITLPGVGRKTANCILSYAFALPAIAVDTHVHRLSNRLGWVKTAAPKETETKLQQILPQEFWSKVNPLLVDYGQRVCLSVKPKCEECKIKAYCGAMKLV